MRVLLDTSYLYGLATAPLKFSSDEWAILGDPDNELFASAVSLWEMRLKYHQRRRSGVRKGSADPALVVELLRDHGVALLDLTPQHASTALKTPLDHKDPFDEILLVQAQIEGLKLLTVDRQLADHPFALAP